MEGDGKGIPTGIELDPAAQDDLLQQGEAALPGDVEIAREDTVGDDDSRLVGMAAFPEGDFPNPERLCCLGLADGNPGELEVVVPDAVVDGVVTGNFGGQGPVDAGGVQYNGEGLQVFRPGHEFTGVMDEQDVSAFFIHRDLDLPARLLLDLLFDKLQDVLQGRRCHSRAGADPELLDGSLFVDLLGGDSHLLAEDLPDLPADQGIVAAQRADLGAASAQRAAVGQLPQAGQGLPVEIDIAVLDLPEEGMFLLDVLADDSSKELRPHCGAVDILTAAGDVYRAGIGADLALDAVLEGVNEGLEKSPVVVRGEEFLDAGQKFFNEGLLLLRCRRRRKTDGDDAVERGVHALALFVRQFPDGRLLHLVVRRRKGAQLGGIELGDLSTGTGEIINMDVFFHCVSFFVSGNPDSVAASAQLFPAGICLASQETFRPRRPPICFSSLLPGRFGSSSQRMKK